MDRQLDNLASVLGNYDIRHLAEHLEQAGKPELLHRILSLENEKRENLWNEVKETVGDTAGYLTDLNRAWRLADSRVDVKLQARYALYSSSTVSVSNNFPGALIAKGVEHDLLKPVQALALIQEKYEEWDRADGLIELIPVLAVKQPVLLSAMFDMAHSLEHAGTRADMLIQLSIYISGKLQVKALNAAFASISQFPYYPRIDWFRKLSQIPAIYNYPISEELFTALRKINSPDYQAEALLQLWPYLSPEKREKLVDQNLKLARSEKDTVAIRTMITLLPCIPNTSRKKLASDILKLAGKLNDEKHLSRAIADTSGELPENLIGHAFDLTQQIKYKPYQGKALAGLAPYLPQTLHEKAVNIARNLDVTNYKDSPRVEALISLSQYVSRDIESQLITEAIIAANDIRYNEPRARAFLLIFHHLQDDRKNQVLREALAAAKKCNSLECANVLIDLAPYLSGELLHEALIRIRELDEQEVLISPRGDGLIGLLPFLEGPLRNQVVKDGLDTLRKIDWMQTRAKLMTKLAPYLPKEFVAEELKNSRKINDDKSRKNALRKVAAAVGEIGTREEVVELVGRVGNEFGREDVLIGLSRQIPVDVLPEIITAVNSIDTWQVKHQTLTNLSIRCFELGLLDKAFSLLAEVNDAVLRAQTLCKMLLNAPDDTVSQILLQARSLPEKYGGTSPRAIVLIGLADKKIEGELEEALRLTLLVEDETVKINMLSRLFLHLPVHLREQIPQKLVEQLSKLGKDFSVANEQALSSKQPTSLLSRLFSHLPVSLQEQIPQKLVERLLKFGKDFSVANEQALPSKRSLDSLYQLRKKIPADISGLAGQRDLVVWGKLRSALSPLQSTPPLPKKLQEERLLTNTLKAIQKLSEQAPDTMKYDHASSPKAYALSQVAPYLSDVQLQEAWNESVAIEWAPGRAHAMVSLFHLLPRNLQLNNLNSVMTSIQNLGVSDEDHQAAELIFLIKHIPENLLSDTLWLIARIRSDGIEENRTRVLNGLVQRVGDAFPSPYVFWRHGCELLHRLARRSRKDVLTDLGTLTPMWADLGGSTLLGEIIVAIQETGRWWP